MLVNGKWTEDWKPVQASDGKGRFVRQISSIRNWVTVDGKPGPTGEGGFAAEAGRYHLYVALICPWACRTLMTRRLKKLDDIISVSIVSPVMTGQGWQFGHFSGATDDHLHHSAYLHELYTYQDPLYSGRATVPVLWDKQRDVMVNNESADIMRMLNDAFREHSDSEYELYPRRLQAEIDAFNDFYYRKLNNGVYRAGFAKTQEAYEEAFDDVFEALIDAEKRLADRSFILGDTLTETDVRLFVTLVRFDAAYYGLFKCNHKRVADYPYLSAYLKRIYNLPGVAETVDIDHIKHGYYGLKALNPSGIVPVGPTLDLEY